MGLLKLLDSNRTPLQWLNPGWASAALDVHFSANSLALQRVVQEGGDDLICKLALYN